MEKKIPREPLVLQYKSLLIKNNLCSEHLRLKENALRFKSVGICVVVCVEINQFVFFPCTTQ